MCVCVVDVCVVDMLYVYTVSVRMSVGGGGGGGGIDNNNGLYCTDKLHIMCYNITMYKSRITIQSSRKLKIYKNIDTNLKTTDLIGLNSQGVFKNQSIYQCIFCMNAYMTL